MPTTSKGRGSLLSDLGRASFLLAPLPSSKEIMRVSTTSLSPSDSALGSLVLESRAASLRVMLPQPSYSRTLRYQRMMSASFCSCRVATVPLSSIDTPETFKSCSTLRSVTGKMAGPSSPSAKRSTTPNGAAANLASGGIRPICTLSGNRLALLSGRFSSSWKPEGSTMRTASFSANGGMN